MAKQRAREYVFRIDAYSPETMPMSRLAEYMADLATLLGEYKSVHFVELKSGSTRLVHAIEREAEPKVRNRINSVRSFDGPPEALSAFRKIDQRLADDAASADIVDPTSKRIIQFPGRKRYTQPTYGPFNQPWSVDGIPIRIGGETDPVPVHLEEENGSVHICKASRSMAREIAPLIFATTIRASGIARWHRERDGTWVQDNFTIHSFRPLKNTSLEDVVGRLRAIPNELGKIEDPLGDLHNLRHGKDREN